MIWSIDERHQAMAFLGIASVSPATPVSTLGQQMVIAELITRTTDQPTGEPYARGSGLSAPPDEGLTPALPVRLAAFSAGQQIHGNSENPLTS
jgi:hypothetical protein